MRVRLAGLWQHPDFMRLWTGQTISEFGSMLTRDALPLAAILVLKATPGQMAFLTAMASLPVLLLGLAAGVWVDRLRRRQIMIWTDLGRALFLLSIPLAAVLGQLGIEQLYLVVFLTGVLTVFFDVAYRSYLPTLVDREQLTEGNSKLSATSSVAEVAGSSIAGVLVQVISAPFTILFDAISFLLSAFFVGRIRKEEPPPVPVEHRSSAWLDAVEGMRVILRDPVLRPLAASLVTVHLCYGIIGPVIGLYAINELGFGPALWGVVISIGGASSFLGAALAGWATRRFGLGRAITYGLALSGLAGFLIPLAGGPLLIAVAFMTAAQILSDSTMTVHSISTMTLRQTVTPERLLGRVNASMDFMAAGISLVGVLIGGLLGETVGLRATIAVGVAGVTLAALWVFFSPVHRLKEQPVYVRTDLDSEPTT